MNLLQLLIHIILMKLNKDISNSSTFIGIDFGIKKIGIAIGQLITKKASPLKIILNSNNNINWNEINSVLLEWKPDVIVIGYPYTSKKNKFLLELDKFIENLTNKYGDDIIIIKFSEVLSTEESKTIYSEMRKSTYNTRRKDNLDDLSASIILQSWFNENMLT